MNIENRISKLEGNKQNGFHVILGNNVIQEEKEIHDYCLQNSVNRNKSVVLYMEPKDVRTL